MSIPTPSSMLDFVCTPVRWEWAQLLNHPPPLMAKAQCLLLLLSWSLSLLKGKSCLAFFGILLFAELCPIVVLHSVSMGRKTRVKPWHSESIPPICWANLYNDLWLSEIKIRLLVNQRLKVNLPVLQHQAFFKHLMNVLILVLWKP